ncbi:hypothetical protein [Halovivax cerinus]|uniref:Uncharacterized protein n=1 Tax=Halovivax cerinus TaxID=1487865 RepID=A0ABD5NLB7_9EURY|nr:hypothetical protein [Halovivax cerinus]
MVFDTYTPSQLLDEQIEDTQEVAETIIIDELEEGPIREDFENAFASAVELTHASTSNNSVGQALYSNIKQIIGASIRHQGFYDMLEYELDQHNDNVVNLVRWFRLYASVYLEERIKFEQEFVLHPFKKYRDDQEHPGEEGPTATPGQPDPLLTSMLNLIWKVIEQILDLWLRILEMGEFQKLAKEGELLGEEDYDVGFVDVIHDDQKEGRIKTYSQAELGYRTKFKAPLDFFPSEGDIVKVYPSENPRNEPADGVQLYDP